MITLFKTILLILILIFLLALYVFLRFLIARLWGRRIKEFEGYFAEIEVEHGAKWTKNFTPPTEEYEPPTEETE